MASQERNTETKKEDKMKIKMMMTGLVVGTMMMAMTGCGTEPQVGSDYEEYRTSANEVVDMHVEDNGDEIIVIEEYGDGDEDVVAAGTIGETENGTRYVVEWNGNSDYMDWLEDYNIAPEEEIAIEWEEE